VTDHQVVSRAEWQAARDELLQREKEHTRMGDELARQRRELPWVTIEKEYRFDTDDGTRTLAGLFDGRSQLLFYHFMFGPSYEAGCPVNSSMADGLNGARSSQTPEEGCEHPQSPAGCRRDPGNPPLGDRQRARVHPSQVTRQVRELENLGLVEVTADTADKRSCRVTLTSAGSDELQSLTEEGMDRFASFVADWESEEVRMLTCLLQKLQESKAAAAARKRPPPGRHWARQTA